MINRIEKYNRLLSDKNSTHIGIFLNEMNISQATFKRDLNLLRNKFNLPVMYDKWNNGYYLADKNVFDYFFNRGQE